MYQTAGIAPLSQTQVSKLLNHHSVRVKAGTHHKVGLSKEQMKKHHKAHMKGTGYTLTFDPFQVAKMQHLRQEVGKKMKVKGGKINFLNKAKKWTGFLGDTVKSIGDHIAPAAKPIIQAATQRAVNEINPTSPADYLQSMAGVGMHKKPRGRPKKGGNLGPSGLSLGGGLHKKKKAPRKKKAMHFSL